MRTHLLAFPEFKKPNKGRQIERNTLSIRNNGHLNILRHGSVILKWEMEYQVLIFIP
jgi:hypothetical protein